MIVKQETTSSHWYDQQGNPAYTIIGKNGKERNTTVKDAREHNYVPSVTTVISLLDKPALTRWKMEQMLLASLTLPRNENESEADWIARVVEDSRSTGKDAMNRGTEMHGVLEAYYSGVYMIQPPKFVIECDLMLRNTFGNQDWISEESFAQHGFGGKVDLHSKNGIIVDFKTKESLDNVALYNEHILQLAAYRMGLNMPTARCAIAFVADNETKIIEVEEEKLQQGYKKFTHLLEYFYLDRSLLQGLRTIPSP